MKKINSRAKGARAERMWRDELIKVGFNAKRGGQQGAGGGVDSPDVICPALSDYHMEIKMVEKLNLRSAMEQATEDSEGRKTPIVCHKTKNAAWLVTMYADDWLNLVKSKETPKEQQMEFATIPVEETRNNYVDQAIREYR